jgi:hypothetical protein
LKAASKIGSPIETNPYTTTDAIQQLVPEADSEISIEIAASRALIDATNAESLVSCILFMYAGPLSS